MREKESSPSQWERQRTEEERKPIGTPSSPLHRVSPFPHQKWTLDRVYKCWHCESSAHSPSITRIIWAEAEWRFTPFQAWFHQRRKVEGALLFLEMFLRVSLKKLYFHHRFEISISRSVKFYPTHSCRKRCILSPALNSVIFISY